MYPVFRRCSSMAVVALVLGLAACTPARSITVDERADGQQIALTLRQTLSVVLPSNPSTGYSWEVAELDPTLLQQGASTFTPDANTPPRVGSGGTETFRFKPLKPGELDLVLTYHRPWEAGVAPIQTFTLRLRIA